jgi:RimJ/RimL family protein N-acetyltransferase
MMIHPEIQGALACERTRTFLAEAEAARRSRLLGRPPGRLLGRLPGRPLPRPSGGRPVRLRDGSAVLIRPVRPEDARLLEDGFAGLSDRSRRMRFLGPKAGLSAAELRYLTDVDHRDHEALGALDHARGGGVGIARYVRDREDPYAAEIAVTVIDGWQGRGLGTELLARLSERACQEGIRRFTAAVAADNAPMTGLLRNLGADVVGREFGTLEYEMALACVPAPRARFRGNAPGRGGLS